MPFTFFMSLNLVIWDLIYPYHLNLLLLFFLLFVIYQYSSLFAKICFILSPVSSLIWMHFRFNNIAIRKIVRCWDPCFAHFWQANEYFAGEYTKMHRYLSDVQHTYLWFWQEHILLTNCRQNTLNSNFAKGTYQSDPLVHYKLSMHFPFFFLSPSVLCLHSMPKHILYLSDPRKHSPICISEKACLYQKKKSPEYPTPGFKFDHKNQQSCLVLLLLGSSLKIVLLHHQTW